MRTATNNRRVADIYSIPLPEYEPTEEARIMRLWERETKYGITPEEEADCQAWLVRRRDALRKALQEGEREALSHEKMLDSSVRSWTPPKVYSWRM